MPRPTDPTRVSGPRIAIVGGGVIGLSAALRLRQRGAEVAVYDRGREVGGGSTMRAAGMLGAAYETAEAGHDPAMFALARRSAAGWPEFAADVERLGGGPVELSERGTIALGMTAEEADRLEDLAAACQARDVPVRRLSAADLKTAEPAVTGKVKLALELPGDRQVDAPLLLQRLAAALTRSGVALKLGRPVETIQADRGFLLPDGERFDRVVLATGAGPAQVRVIDRFGAALNPGLGRVVPVKGQILALAPIAGGPRHVIRLGHGLYIAPKSRWTLVGATSEWDRSDTEVDRGMLAALRARAEAAVGAIGRAEEVAVWAGVRPASTDGLPMIGPTAVDGLFAALGHYRNGILLAPGAADLIADMVIDGKVSALAEPFSPLRFDNAAAAPHSP